MLENKKDNMGRRALIGVCVGVIISFAAMIIRSLYVCNTRETIECTLDTFSIPLGAIIVYTALLLIAIFKYEWIASGKRTSKKEWRYLIMFLIILLILMLAYYIYS